MSARIASSSQQLQFALLGPPEVRWGQQVVHFRTRKSLALLVYLVMTRTTQPRERLATLLWPDSDDSHARALLRRTLAYLKDALPPPLHTLVGAVRDTLGREALRFDAELAVGSEDGTGDTPTVQVRFDTDLIERAAGRAAQPSALDSPSARGEEDETALVGLLVRAAQLYRGPFLDGLHFDDTPKWEEWVQQQRAFWQRQIAMAFDRLVRVELDTGRLDEALVHAQRWSELLPFDEMAQLALMQALVACDDRPGALTAFAVFHKRLAAELDLEPSAALVALAEQLRLHERSAPASGNMPAVHRKVTTDSTASLRTLQPEMPFAGREAEFAALVGAMTQAMQERRQQVVIVQGEAGIGKTRLLDEFLRWAAAQGADVVRAQALETGGRLPYQPLVDVLRPQLARANAPEDLLDDVWLAELARLFPELRERYPDLPPPGVEDSTAQHRLFDAVANLVLALAQRAIRASPPAATRGTATVAPLVRVFDDLHWADAGTRELLRHLLRRFQEERLPLLIVLALRSGWQGSAIEPNELLRDLGRRHDVASLVLEPLSEGAVASGLGRILQEQSASMLARWLYAETTGQPLYLQQMLQMLFERGLLQWSHQSPEAPQLHVKLTPTARLELVADAAELDRLRGQLPVSVRAVLIERLQRLSPPARRLLGAAAVIGSRFDFEQAAEVAQLAEADALDALEEAERLLLVRSVTDETGAIGRAQYQFTHDKLREVSYTEIGEARRRTLSRRALGVLEADGGASAAELARYALAGGMSVAAFHFNILAGDEALTIFAVQDAIAHYEQARSLLTESTNQTARTPSNGRQFAADEPARLHLQLGRAYEWQGNWDQARELYHALRQSAHLASDRTLEATALTRLALVAREQLWDLPSARTLVTEALALVEPGGDMRVVAETLWTLAAVTAQCGDLDAARAAIDRSLELARKGQLEELVARGHVTLWQIHTFVGDWDETIAAAREARERYRALADELRGRYAESPRHRTEAASARLLWSGAPPSNVAAYRSMEAVGFIGICIGEINRGDPPAAIQAGREALRLLEEATNAQVTALASLCLALGLTEIGSYEEALAVARRGLEAAQVSGDLYSMVATRCALAHTLQAVGSIDEAAALLREALAIAERIPVTYWSLRPLAYLCANRAVADDWSTAGDIAFRAIATRAATHSRLVYFDFVRHHEIEALLHSGALDEARREVVKLGERLTEAEQDRRFRLTHLRMRATQSRWEGNPTAEIGELETAHALAVELDLPGERWQIAAQLGAAYRSLGDHARSAEALEEARIIMQSLAARINDQPLRQAYLHAAPWATKTPPASG
jgi:DNA-binding SARP family transcriptional activator/tetratricopeptide (TPR) repeat protein